MTRARHLLRNAGAAAIALAALLSAPASVLAQCPQTSLAEIEEEVTCPVCGTPLALATDAPQAQREREFIIRRIERCQSEEEIKAALVAQYGEEVLATPGDDGFDVAAYALPGAALLAGAGAIALAAARWRRGRSAPAPEAPGTHQAGSGPPGAATSAESSRLDRDLERYDL